MKKEMKRLRVLVCGGRDFNDKKWLYEVLDDTHSREPGAKIGLIIHGNANGADTLAGKWARDRGIICEVYTADWKVFGVAAGHMRNAQMLEIGKPNLVIAFPGGPGTANMIARAHHARVAVEVQEKVGGRESGARKKEGQP